MIPLALPPLRERAKDIQLGEYFCGLFAPPGRSAFDYGTSRRLEAHLAGQRARAGQLHAARRRPCLGETRLAVEIRR